MGQHRLAWVAVVLSLLCAGGVAAQVTARDTIEGQVVSAAGGAIPLARIRVSDAAGAEARTRSDSAGRYRIDVAGSGSYALVAEALGYLPLHTRVSRGAKRGRIVRDIRLNITPVELAPLVVRGRRARAPRRTPAPGEIVDEFGALTTELLPLEPGDLERMAALAPGAIRTGGDEGALSIAGQAPDQTHFTLDGATYGGSRLPAEAVRSVETLSHPYDVAMGRFSGGRIAATTMAGTNRWGAGGSVRLEEPALRYGAPTFAGPIGSERAIRVSAGGGGPIVRDRLFVFAAGDADLAGGPAAALDAGNDGALRTLGVAADSVRRFEAILGTLGVPRAPLVDDRREAGSVLVRLDYQPSATHAVTARADWRGSAIHTAGASPLRLPGGQTARRQWDAGAYAQLASSWDSWSHDLRVSVLAGERRTRASDLVPEGVVRLWSDTEDGVVPATLSFGGAPTLAAASDRALLEVSDEVTHAIRGGTHRLKAGVLLQREGAGYQPRQDPGRFTFDGLAALAEGRPAVFARSASSGHVDLQREHAAAYVGDTWTPDDRLSVALGIRIEGSRYGDRGPFAHSVAEVAGDARGDVPSEVIVGPRLGFTYRQKDRQGLTFRGGAGLFSGAASMASLALRWSETGSGVSRDLLCLSGGAPSPDWAAYRSSPLTIPSACIGTGEPGSDVGSNVTLFERSYRSPRTWRATFGVDGSLTRRISFFLNAAWIRGEGQATAVDRNLNEDGGFVLAEEADRPVYAPPTAIDVASGRVAPGASRRSSELAFVRVIGSDGRSRTGQVSAGVTGIIGRNTLVGLSYAHGISRVRGTGVPAPGGAAASTAGDPGLMEWGPSDYDRRHALQVVVMDRLSTTVQLGAVAQFGSGLPFTPMIGADINGDGLANDRAFVPTTGSSGALGAEMSRLFADAPSRVRRCLERQAGRIAARGSCRGPWSSSLDLLLEYSPHRYVDSRRLTFSLTAENVTAGLDYLLHGERELRGWGQHPFVDTNLLEVRGFDPVRGRYQYAVNPRFGRSPAGGGGRIPFGIIVQARVTLGADPRFQPVVERAEALIPLHAPAVIRLNLAERIRNVPRTLIALDSADPGELRLSPEQAQRLRAGAEALEPRIAEALDGLSDALGAGLSPASRRSRVEVFAEVAYRAHHDGLALVRSILTPEQLSLVPVWLMSEANREGLMQLPSLHTPGPRP